jgi:hypothetical protein
VNDIFVMLGIETCKPVIGALLLPPAPMGMGGPCRLHAGDWMPSRAGFDMVNIALHEWLGRVGGA